MRVFRAAKELGFNTVRAAPCTCRLQQLAPNKEKCTLQLQHGSLTCNVQHTRKCDAALTQARPPGTVRVFALAPSARPMYKCAMLC